MYGGFALLDHSLLEYIIGQEHNQDDRQAGEGLLFADINIGGYLFPQNRS